MPCSRPFLIHAHRFEKFKSYNTVRYFWLNFASVGGLCFSWWLAAHFASVDGLSLVSVPSHYLNQCASMDFESNMTNFVQNAFITFALNFNAKLLDVNTLCVWAPSREVHALCSVSMNLPGLTIDLSQRGTTVLHVICHEISAVSNDMSLNPYLWNKTLRCRAEPRPGEDQSTRQGSANPRETLIDHCVEMNTKHRRQNRHQDRLANYHNTCANLSI